MTTEDVDDDLLEALDRGLRHQLLEGAVVGLSMLLVMVLYAAAAARWPGSPLAWGLLGWAIVVTAMLNVWGPPWRST